MSGFVITTPVQIMLYWVGVDALPPVPAPTPLGGEAGTVILAVLLAQLQQAPPPGPAEAASLAQFLDTPLKTAFDNAWSQLQSGGSNSPASMVQAAVQKAAPNAYNIQVSTPSSGTQLTASTGALGTDILQTLPAGTTGTQLLLTYSLPGFSVSFSETTSGIFGSWADPSYNLTFDADIEVIIGVPDDILVPPGVIAELNTSNMHGSAANFFATVDGVLSLIPKWLGVILGAALGGVAASGLGAIAGGVGGGLATGGGSPSQPQNQTVPLSANELQSILGDLSFFAGARRFGFTQLGVRVNTNPPPHTPAGNTVEFDLTHPFDPGPVVSNAVLPPSQTLFAPRIGPSPPEVAAGGQLGVMGSSFPPAQATQLKITWTDTTSGNVVQSEIDWGILPGGQQQPPVLSPAVLIPRNGSYDNANNYTFKPLLPNTTYAFRVRDYDLFKLAATDWSKWLPLTTQATDQVEIVLSYQNTTIGFGQVQSDGSFSTTVIVPAGVPPGTYTLTAVMAGVPMAETQITVVAQGQALTPLLQVVDPNTLIAYSSPAGVVGGVSVTVQGQNYTPGAVDLFLDTAGGVSLGVAHVAANKTEFTFSFQWPEAVAGLHKILAQQGALQAFAAVFAQLPPQ
jgi:hypothetical protein